MSTPKTPSKPASRARIAVAVSGSGRSLANFLHHQPELGSYTIAAVIASRPNCYGVTIAHEHNLPTFIGSFTQEHLPLVGEGLYDWLAEIGIDWIALAGFLRPFPLDHRWEKRVINIHPALLPAFGGRGMYGDHVHRAVLAQKETQTGATVHFVNEHYDDGAIIAQITVPVAANDTVASLADRVFAAECRLYPHTLDLLLKGELPLPQGHVLRLDYAAS